MIYFGRKKWGKSLSALLVSKEIFAEEAEISQIEKLLNKGTDVHCDINPYMSEMYVEGEGGYKNHLIWDTDADALDNLCWQLSEEV